jgi:uncharacterized membrane protein
MPNKAHPKKSAVRNVNQEHTEKLTVLEKLALKVTEKVGSPGFFLIILVWTVFWLGWNCLAPQHLRFDPPMSFVLWLFISNMIQIFLMPLIMVGQNLQARHAELRAESDFDINTKAEEEIENILQRLAQHQDLLEKILKRIDEKLN